MHTYDVVVIGGSFAGLSAALQLARARRRVLVVDAGMPRNRVAHASHGMLGHDGRPPHAILDAAREQLRAYPTASIVSGSATDAAACDGAFDVTLDSATTVRGRRLVLATGVIDDLPDMPGLPERWGRTVLHCPYCHGFEVADRRLGVLGVGAASVHQALLLPDWSDDVTLFTNGAFAPDAEQIEALGRRGVRVDARPVAALVGAPPALHGVVLRDGRGEEVVGIDALFVAARTRLASPIAGRLGCAVDEGPLGPVVRTDPWKETTVPGVYAAGDSARAPHNVTWASADGVTAGIGAHRSLALA